MTRSKKSSKKLRGFTLIEVLVAMTILALASMLLVGMYGSVVKHIRSNNEINDRMTEQQKFVETKTQKSAVGNNDVFEVKADSRLSSNTAYSSADTSSTIFFEIKCTYNKADTSWVNNKNFYSNCAVYSLKNIEDGEPVSGASDTDNMKVDYKYFVGDNTMVP